jgi:membrane associated rhomboid family serine protease
MDYRALILLVSHQRSHYCNQMSKNNGSKYNGTGGGDKEEDRNIVHFPTLADRDRMRKEKIAQEEAWRAEYKAKQKILNKTANPAFFNMESIPPFVRVIVPLMIGIQAVLSLFMSETEIFGIYNTFGFVPAKIFPAPSLAALVTPITHMFLHGGWMHIAFNIFMLVALGVFISREFGTKLTYSFFFISGLCGALLYLLVNPSSQQPLIGASGGISGFFSVYLVMMYRHGGFNQFKLVRKFGVLAVIGFWVLLMFMIAMLMGGQSWEAHTGGYIGGLLFLCWLLRGDLRVWKL